MSKKYDEYLIDHKDNVRKGLYWLLEFLPGIFSDNTVDLDWQINFAHDISKDITDEYDAYDAYFYGNNKTYKVVTDFKYAWLRHIHRNPHHWQHWVLINDDPGEGMVILDMPDCYVIEMICDWWSFSWKTGNLLSIFDWYAEHKEYMKLSDRTRKNVELILYQMKNILEGVIV